MAVDRIQAYQGENQVNIHDQEIDLVMTELNKGIDVKTIGPKAITADKMRILYGSLKYLNFSTIAAGNWGNPGFFFVEANGGIGEGVTSYLHSVYWDVYVDGTGAGPSPYSSVIVQGNTTAGLGGGGIDAKDKFLFKWYPITSKPGNADTAYLMGWVCHIKNDDASNHTYQVAVSMSMIATQLTGGS